MPSSLSSSYSLARLPTIRECVPVVTRGHLRSRDKDGGHTIRSAIVLNPMLYAKFVALCSRFIKYRTEVIADQRFILREQERLTFVAPMTLTLTR